MKPMAFMLVTLKTGERAALTALQWLSLDPDSIAFERLVGTEGAPRAADEPPANPHKGADDQRDP